jgi:hypothetical protein
MHINTTEADTKRRSQFSKLKTHLPLHTSSLDRIQTNQPERNGHGLYTHRAMQSRGSVAGDQGSGGAAAQRDRLEAPSIFALLIQPHQGPIAPARAEAAANRLNGEQEEEDDARV